MRYQVVYVSSSHKKQQLATVWLKDLRLPLLSQTRVGAVQARVSVLLPPEFSFLLTKPALDCSSRSWNVTIVTETAERPLSHPSLRPVSRASGHVDVYAEGVVFFDPKEAEPSDHRRSRYHIVAISIEVPSGYLEPNPSTRIAAFRLRRRQQEHPPAPPPQPELRTNATTQHPRPSTAPSRSSAASLSRPASNRAKAPSTPLPPQSLSVISVPPLVGNAMSAVPPVPQQPRQYKLADLVGACL